MKSIIDLILSFFKPRSLEETVDLTIVGDREELHTPINTSPTGTFSIAFKNDSPRLKREFSELETKNKEFRDLLKDLNAYTNSEFGKNIIITMIYRTKAEQDYLYRNNAKYKKRNFKSPHQFHHGGDLRSRTFTQSEITQTVEWLNKRYNSTNYYKWTAKCHDVGSGMHFHIQYVKQ